jgi:hypothetical protein
VPPVTFVHYTTTAPPRNADPAVRQFSESAYRELLWHMLLRGHDTFFLWCPPQEIAREVRPLHEVWTAALECAAPAPLHLGSVTLEVPRASGNQILQLPRGAK